MFHLLDGRGLVDAGRQDNAALGLPRGPLHRVEQCGRHLQVHPVAARLPVRPYGESVLALAAVRRRLHEDAQQRLLEDR